MNTDDRLKSGEEFYIKCLMIFIKLYVFCYSRLVCFVVQITLEAQLYTNLESDINTFISKLLTSIYKQQMIKLSKEDYSDIFP